MTTSNLSANLSLEGYIASVTTESQKKQGQTEGAQ